MAMSRADAYKSRRIAAAIRGGFLRSTTPQTPTNTEALRRGLTRLWERSLGRPCPLLCGVVLTPKKSAFCHDIALASGGEHTIRNIYLACGRCNKAQHTMTKGEYLKLRNVIIEEFGEERWKKIRGWLAGAKH